MLIAAARKYLGQREVAGPGFNAWIKSMWLGLPSGKWFWEAYGSDDTKLPWCGAFMARVCQDLRIAFPAKYASAAAWAEWGFPASGPHDEAVAVLTRKGGSHVGIVTGVSPDRKYIRLLGGNQGDAVGEAWFAADRVTAYRYMPAHVLPKYTIASVGTLNKSEA